MPDIFHDFPIRATSQRVFDAVSTPEGLDQWWTKKSSGQPHPGAEYELWFGPKFDWRGMVVACVPPSHFELQITSADQDWMGTRVGFRLEPNGDLTNVHFYHTGWPAANEHWRVSSYCWAMYLRIMRRYLEFGERVEYEKRLQV